MSITRRAFLGGLAVLPFADLSSVTEQTPSGPPRVDGAVLRQRIEALSMCGRPDGGTFADGVSRVAYSEADVAGRAYIMRIMRAAGLEPVVDPAGNIFGRRAGRDNGLPPILFGSHIDSVPNGATLMAISDRWPHSERLRRWRRQAFAHCIRSRW